MRRLKGFLIALAVSMGGVEAAAQVDTAWTRRYNGPANGGDLASALTVDGSGNVYVTGQSDSDTGTFTINTDYATIKYSPSGDTLWVRYYNGPGNDYDEATALSVDNGGNVCVTGYSGIYPDYDYATLKYAPDGDTLWNRRYDGSGNASDYARDLAVDPGGNIYVTGYSAGAGTSNDYATIKYSPAGDTLWIRRYNGPDNSDDYAFALAVDDSGNVYVTGESWEGGSNYDYATIKYSPFGDTLWVRKYNGTGNLSDAAYDLAVDDGGNVYITGVSYDGSTSNDYVTIKYSPAGDSLWVRRYNGPGNDVDYAYDLAVDGSGNVYVTGYSGGSGTSYDYATIKYSPSGDTLWVARYNGPGNDDDNATALSLDGAGNVYVAGRSVGSGTDDDYTTIKYSPAGDTLWVARYNGFGSGGDHASGLALDGSGNVYVTGRSDGSGTEADYATIKYVQSCVAIPGDANSSGDFSIGDIISVVNYYFNKPGWPACGSNSPLCWLSGMLCRGDWNGNGVISIGDIVHGVN
ncbi:MAG: SBBP repeat-containing protein, partial [candidate division Zixibacteria bacterium]|nr:SBBP repeat-containing protein [candidate division Zixibacteria bacterium]